MAEDNLLENTLNPFDLFAAWFEEAGQKEPNDPNAVALASVDNGQPSLRMVLLKEWSKSGFIFYTNFHSRKGKELLQNPHAAMLFHWKSLRRQIRIEGRVEEVTPEQADNYFASRPKSAQIGAWASLQSDVMEGRLVFEKRIAKYTAQYAVSDVPRPPHWSGFQLVPHRIEFWADRKFRLHDRLEFNLIDGEWQGQKLYP